MQFSEAALQWLNNLSSQGILLTDANLTICGWNQWLESHTGRKSSEMIGVNLFEAYPDLVERRLDEYYKDALARQIRIISQRLHGYLLPMAPSIENQSFVKMQQSARIAPLVVEERVVGTITLIDDVTERVEREDRLVELLKNEKIARADAERANRAKDEFLATVSHELRTPLNSILGWAQILLNGKCDAESSINALQSIERSAKAQAKLVEDILDASRIITGKLQLEVRPVELASVIEAAIDTVRPAADAKSIQIESALDAWVGPVLGDPSRLQQIAWNLLNNAIKFTKPFGQVFVRLRRADTEVEVTISDNGQGISSDFLPNIFDRFRQADSSTTRKHGGLGLGLAIVKQLVESHGGTIRAESEGEGRGATFRMRLPLVALHTYETLLSSVENDGDVELAEKPDRGTHLPALDDLRVLVVDDDTDSREILKIMLTRCGASVKTAGAVSEALETIKEWLPDVLISDIGMPEEDGYSLINKIRALDPESGGMIPAVALTGYAGSDDRPRSLSAGYHTHIAKPVEFSELATVVASLGRIVKSQNA
jgi:signal transduction histidine kinase/ActR/RegA family two-component response regulator